jgi:hypothetical protein
MSSATIFTINNNAGKDGVAVMAKARCHSVDSEPPAVAALLGSMAAI